MNARQPARPRAHRRLRIELYVEVEEIKPVEQKPADQVDHDEQVEAENRSPRAHLERRDRHRQRTGDERRRGGDEERHHDAADRDAAEYLRDGKNRDPADQQRDDEK